MVEALKTPYCEPSPIVMVDWKSHRRMAINDQLQTRVECKGCGSVPELIRDDGIMVVCDCLNSVDLTNPPSDWE